jgi:hypothetical protein
LTLIEQYGRKIAWSKQSKKSISLFQYIPRVFDGTLENTDSESDSPGYQQSDSLEMQYLNTERENETGKPKVHRAESVDYKANTP